MRKSCDVLILYIFTTVSVENLNFSPTGSCYQKCNNLGVRGMVA